MDPKKETTCHGAYSHSANCKHFYPSKAPLPPVKNVESNIYNKIQRYEKLLNRYQAMENTESAKIVPNLEKINNTENSCFGTVGVLLDRYSSLDRWESLNMKTGYILEAIMRQELEELELKQQQMIKSLEKKIREIDGQTKKVNNEGDHLIDYACTSFAEMTVAIETIKNFRNLLEYGFEYEVNQMTKQIREFKEKIEYHMRRTENNIKSNVQKEVYERMDEATLQMERTNMEIRGIIEVYQGDIEKKSEYMDAISKEIKSIGHDPVIDPRKNYFPEMFFNRPDCTPETELELDIPIKRYIPI